MKINMKQDLQWQPSDLDAAWIKPLTAQWRTPEQSLPIMGASCIGWKWVDPVLLSCSVIAWGSP